MKKKGGVTCFSWHLVEIPLRSMPTSPMDLDSEMRTTQILTFIESCQQFSNIEIVKMTFFCARNFKQKLVELQKGQKTEEFLAACQLPLNKVCQ
jgi:hypothetical protein